MRLKNDWLPYDLNGRASVFKTIAANIDQYGLQLGLSAGQITRIKEIAAAFDYANSIVRQAEASMKSLVAWRRAVMDQKTRVGQPANAPPPFPAYNVPAGTTIGMVAEMRKYVAIMKASPNYLPGIGTALNILPPPASQLSLAEIWPRLKLSVQNGTRLDVRCVMMTMDALRLEYSPLRSDPKWRTIAFLTTVPASVDIEFPADTAAEAGSVRGIFMKKNKTVGKWSPNIDVTLSR